MLYTNFTYLHERVGKVLAAPVTESRLHRAKVLSSILTTIILIILTQQKETKNLSICTHTHT